MMTSKNIGLYVHIPFCKRKCADCDFCSFADGEVSKNEYIDALISDIESYKGRGVSLDSIFFGGGTPSMLSGDELLRICESIKKAFKISSDTEFTLEANPATVSAENLSGYISAGVNRISIGLQSIHENELKILGRIHTYDEFKTTHSLCRDAGIKNINVDLMYAFPRQTVESLTETLNNVLALSPEHISLYGLILEEGTPLYNIRDSFEFPDEDDELLMYRTAADILKKAGYLHYEISNYAREGFESRHNLKYWRDAEYIGVGLSAYSYFEGVRYGKGRDMREYLTSPTKNAYFEPISRAEEKKEYVMLALRLRDGLSYSDYKARFSEDFTLGKEGMIVKYEKLGLLHSHPDGIALTDEGFYLSNTIISSLM